MFHAITNIGKEYCFGYQMIKHPTIGVVYKVY